MIWIIIAAIVTYMLAGACNGVMDKLQFHYGKSIFPPSSLFWCPRKSWRNKYKNGDPAQGPKFIGSTTIFVGFTDGWHMMQMGYLACQRLSIVLAVALFTNYPFWVYAAVWVILIVIHAIGFHLTYTIFLKNETENL